MYKIYQGNTGSGKTTRIKKKYQQLAAEVGSEKILLFLNSARAVSKFREDLALNRSGNLSIFTYFGFINQELNRNWPAVEKNIVVSSRQLSLLL